MCGGRTHGTATASYHIGRGTFDLGIFHCFMLQSKPVFCLKLSSALRGLSHRRGHVLRSFVTLVGPICFTTTRYHRWVPTAGVRGSCKCSCRHTTPFKCAAAAVQLLSHPLSPPQTHPVGVRTCYHTPFLSPPLVYHTPQHTFCECSDVLSHPLVYHNPLGPPASCTLSPGVRKISHPPQDTTPGNNNFKSQNVITGVCYLVSVTVYFPAFGQAVVTGVVSSFW